MERETPARAEGEASSAGQQVFLRKFASDFMQEMNRSVRMFLEDWRG